MVDGRSLAGDGSVSGRGGDAETTEGSGLVSGAGNGVEGRSVASWSPPPS